METVVELVLFYAATLVLSLSSVYLLGLLADRRRNLPPGPRPLPLVGSLLSLGTDPHRSLARLAQRHGPVMALRLGTVTTVVAGLLRRRRPRLPPAARRRLLRALRPRRHPRVRALHALRGLAPGHQPAVARAPQGVLCGALRAAPPRHAAVPAPGEGAAARVPRGAAGARGRPSPRRPPGLHHRAQPAVNHHLLHRPRRLHDDRRVVSTTGPEFKAVLAELNFTVGLPNISDFFPEIARLDLQGLRRRIEGLIGQLHAMINEQVERRLRERASATPPATAAKTKKNFLDILLDYRSASDGRGFERQTILSLISDLFSAGTDTSSAMVEWAMAELLLNPASMARAREELDQVVGSRTEVEESDIGQLKYLQAIVKETFRLHPPAPFLLPHLAETTTQVRGEYTVPKGARLLVNVWAIGHDAEVWPEPERFLGDDDKQEQVVDFRGRDFELLPFGSGRRMCPGTPLAVRMVHLMLASLLHRFHWSLPADVEKLDMSERLGLNLSMATPLQAIATSV